VAFFGLGAVSAAVMSSTDSSMLSASTMLARNVYQKVFRPKAKEREVLWALWVLICINCVIATTLALTYKSIYDLFVLCGDFMFVVVFPQLTFVLYWEKSNTYGSVSSFFTALFLRLLCGEKKLGLPKALDFGKVYGEPGSCPLPEDEMHACTGEMPYRTFVTIIGALVFVLVTLLTDHLFKSGKVDLEKDFMHCFKKDSKGEVVNATSRHMEENIEMKIPRPKIGDENGGYKNSGYM